MTVDPRLDCQPVSPKTGQEPFTRSGRPLDATLLDFWQWSGSDLLANTYRAYIAEYIVGLAVGSREEVAEPWTEYDLDTPDGIKIEVKATCELQTWAQKNPSRPVFGVRPAKKWDESLGRPSGALKRHADVYVFAVLCTPKGEMPDPLDVDQWDFYVVATQVVNDVLGMGAKTVSLPRLRSLEHEAVGFTGLHDAVRKAAGA